MSPQRRWAPPDVHDGCDGAPLPRRGGRKARHRERGWSRHWRQVRRGDAQRPPAPGSDNHLAVDEEAAAEKARWTPRLPGQLSLIHLLLTGLPRPARRQASTSKPMSCPRASRVATSPARSLRTKGSSDDTAPRPGPLPTSREKASGVSRDSSGVHEDRDSIDTMRRAPPPSARGHRADGALAGATTRRMRVERENDRHSLLRRAAITVAPTSADARDGHRRSSRR